MKSILNALAVLLTWPLLSWGSVSDPITDFKMRFITTPGDKIIKWETDLNSDGRNEVLFCLKSDFNTDIENHDVPGWSVYIAEASPISSYSKSDGTEYEAGKLSVGDLPQIDTSACFVGQITQLGKRGIVSMRIKNPRSGESVATIYAYTIEGNHLKYTQLAQYEIGQASAVFDQYLKDDVRTQIQLQEVVP